jgi:hypothetical protein
MNINKYANTIIYKIVCNDENITDVYVGHTINFQRRKRQHKSHCNTLTSNHYNLKVYEKIRAKGGWSRWNMTVIEEFPCDNKKEAAIRERYYFEELNANLNTCIPNQSQKEYDEINKTKIKLYQKEYQEKNKTKIKEYQYYELNKEKIKAQRRLYNELNKEKINAQQRARRLKKKQNIDITV